MPTSLAEIVALAETNGEMLLAARIHNHVKLVSLKPGNLKIGFVGAAPDQLAGDIARYLSQWTGQRWLVSLSESGGSQTLAEEQRDADEKLRDTIASEPLIVQILDIFPGASIDEIKKLGLGSAAQHEQWLADMKKIFPDVNEGQQLTGVFAPGQASRFFFNGKPIGDIDDPEFGLAFFGIWLHPKTSAPKLRQALLGSK